MATAANSVTIENHNEVVLVRVDDTKANAYSAEVLAAISNAVSTAEADDDTGAVVIAGRPGLFSGGFDLGVMRGGDMAAISNLVSDGGSLVRQCFGAGIPVVAACTGHAVAAGALLLLGCDVRVGADIDAKIGLPEVTIGMGLPLWAVTISRARLNPSHLYRSTSLGQMLSPADAMAAGYLDELAAADDVIDRAVEVAQTLAGSINGPAYRSIVAATRSEILDTMGAQIAADRGAVA